MEAPDIPSFKDWCKNGTLSECSINAYCAALTSRQLLQVITQAAPTKGWSRPVPIASWASNDGFMVVQASSQDKSAKQKLSCALKKYIVFRGMPEPSRAKRRRLTNQPPVQQQAPLPAPVQQPPPPPQSEALQSPPPISHREDRAQAQLSPWQEEQPRVQQPLPQDDDAQLPSAAQPEEEFHAQQQAPPEAQDIVPWFPRFYDSDYAEEIFKRKYAFGYSTKDMHKSTKMAWKSERKHFGTVRKGERERDERVRRRKAVEVALPNVDKVIEVKSAPRPRHTRYPQLTKKYLQLKCDRPELASQAFRMLSQSIGLCQQADDVTVDPSTNALLLYKKGAWELTKLGTKCELHANEELICLDHRSSASVCLGPLFALTECTNVFTVGRFASIQFDMMNRFERRPNSSPFFDIITKTTPYKQARGMGNVMRMFEKPKCDTMPVYAFPLVQTRDPDWNKDTKFTFEKIAIDREVDLKGWILMLHFGMLYTFFLNSIAHNPELVHQQMFHQILRQLLLAVHPDQWSVQTAECPALKSFLAHFHHRLAAWHLCFKTSWRQKKT